MSVFGATVVFGFEQAPTLLREDEANISSENVDVFEIDGFRGIRWGTHWKDVKERSFVGNEKNVKIFRRRGEKLLFGNVKLTDVWYMFLGDKFFSTVILADVDSFYLMEPVLRGKFGEPSETNFKSSRWGEREDVEIIAVRALPIGFLKRRSAIIITSNKVMQAYEKWSSKEVSKDFLTDLSTD